jgi:hypothetical protein
MKSRRTSCGAGIGDLDGIPLVGGLSSQPKRKEKEGRKDMKEATATAFTVGVARKT